MEQLTWEQVQTHKGVIGGRLELVSMGIRVRGKLQEVTMVNGEVNQVQFTIGCPERTMDTKSRVWVPCSTDGKPFVVLSVPLTTVPEMNGGSEITFGSKEVGAFALFPQ